MYFDICWILLKPILIFIEEILHTFVHSTLDDDGVEIV
jgi:hypothetical protein